MLTSRNRLFVGVSVAALIVTARLMLVPQQRGGAAGLPALTPVSLDDRTASNQTVRQSPIDGMKQLFVPAGEFWMGSAGDDQAGLDERPRHMVWLNGFWIDETEVTNAMFERFVQATNHRTLAEANGFTYGFVEGEFVAIAGASWRHPLGPGSSLAGLGQHPVVTMAWRDARAYCRWARRRLPSEAEWERAARGRAGRRYPWGNALPTGAEANLADARSGLPWADTSIDDGYARTAPVGSYRRGTSPTDAVDMAGNAWEWVSDWYDPNWYRRTSQFNPRGPRTGTFKVIRGGSYADDAVRIRSARRTFDDTTHTTIESGFRCAQSDRIITRYLPVVERPPTPTATGIVAPTITPVAWRPATSTPGPPGSACDAIPGASYKGIRTNGGWDGRPAQLHPDINLSVRGWTMTTAHLGLVDMDGAADDDAPRLYGLLPARYGPGRADFSSVYKVYDWIWSRGQRGAPLGNYDVTLVGMYTGAGEELRVPSSGYDIGRLQSLAPQLIRHREARRMGPHRLTGGYSALVLYASEERITLTYTRDDTAARGYLLHVEGVCVEPTLRELYERLSRAGRRELPALRAGDAFGRARDSEILVAIRDSGTFMDPRSRKDWWR